MNPERWGRIKEIYHSALEFEPGRREEFLKEACAGDESLFKEVTSLLAQKENSEGLFEAPALEAVARALAEDEANKPHQNLTGQILSHYRIEKKIGEGGMGEVFIAQDTSLNRKVALKFLPPEMQGDPVAHKRFLREARSAAALDNPHICTIYEVGEFEGKNFIVMEYVDGQTLTEKLRRGRLPLNQALQIATEVAEALQAAHGEGIIHRDLKPSNIMLTKTGHAKVMDFGLAKQIVQAGGIESQEESVTAMTRSGMTLGTLAYMSPEQVRGEAIDARSDIFSFGLLLYEMMTGKHPFRKESPMETASAILHEEAKSLGAITRGVPVDLEKLINRCLRKEADRRIQHMDDAKLALEEIKRDLDSGQSQETYAPATKFTSVRLVTGILAVVALILLTIIAWYWQGRKRSEEQETALIAVPLTSYPGYEYTPSFSNDGNYVAFQWCKDGPGINCHIYIKQIGVEPPFQLTTDAAEDFSPSWSPDGRFIAFLRRISATSVDLMIIPQRGGQERRVLRESNWASEPFELKSACYLAWTPDSKGIVFPSWEFEKHGLLLLSLETGEKRGLTKGMSRMILAPAFSPDGRTLVFTHFGVGLTLLRLAEGYMPPGKPERLADTWWSDAGAAWMADGSEIVFVLHNSLWRMPASGSANPRKIALPNDNASTPTLSRQGNRLAYSVEERDANIWHLDLRDLNRKPGTPAQFISSTRTDIYPAYSPDGKRVAFCSNRSGVLGIWLCNSDGSNQTQLTSAGFQPRWSPDGRSIAFTRTMGGNMDVWVIDATGGVPRRLTTDSATDKWPWWSRDGQSIYFASALNGSDQIWKMPATGGAAVQITPNGEARDVPNESPDGKFIYYLKGYPAQCSVWRMPSGGGDETKVLDSVHCEGLWTVREQGIYYFRPADEAGRSNMCLYEFATGKTTAILTIERPVYNSIAASPDGSTILFTQIDRSGADLMLVENFR